MLIDWFTVGAQALNFLIMVWLMKRFLYKPILSAIDAREKKIATEITDANAKKVEAKKESDEFRKKNEIFDLERTALLTKATDEAKAERARLLDEARKSADQLRVKRQDAMQAEQESFNKEISHRAQDEIFAIARKTLSDLAGASLEERITEVFIDRLRELKPTERDTLKKSLEAKSVPAIVRSTFELPEAQRSAIKAGIKELFSIEPALEFQTAASLVSGIELSANGQKIGWNISTYLDALRKSMTEVLKTSPAPQEAHDD